MAVSKVSVVFDLVPMVSDVTIEDLQKDGDKAITMVDVAEILVEAVKINDILAQFERLGNVLGPLLQEAAAKEQPIAHQQV